MIHPITQARFRKLFPKPFPPSGSIAELLAFQTVETQWYEDPERHKIGVVVYDRYDKDWQAIVLKKRNGVYQAYQLKHSLSTEKTAADTLLQLFEVESEDFRQFMTEQDKLTKDRTGKSLSDIMLGPRAK